MSSSSGESEAVLVRGTSKDPPSITLTGGMWGSGRAADPAGWLPMVATGSAFFMIVLDTSIVNLALARIGAEFGAGLSTLQWLSTVTLAARCRGREPLAIALVPSASLCAVCRCSLWPRPCADWLPASERFRYRASFRAWGLRCFSRTPCCAEQHLYRTDSPLEGARRMGERQCARSGTWPRSGRASGAGVQLAKHIRRQRDGWPAGAMADAVNP